MATPNMAAITASLERSLQSFSLNHQSTTTSGGDGMSSSTVPETTTTNCRQNTTTSDATLELDSNITLPYHWERCLDLKTGEMYYINWRTGMKTKDHPRTVENGFSGYFFSDDDEENEDVEVDEEESSYDGSYGSGSGSSVESSPAASSSRKPKQKDDDDEGESRLNENNNNNNNNVLVVAGCKGCFMYFMVPKQVEDCPKCCGQLLHFDRADDN